MKKIYCELHIFDLHQSVYIIDPSTGDKECIAIATMEELPEVISAISSEKKISKVLLSGNSVFGDTVSESIVKYSKKNYNWNNIEVEVLK
jgi:monoamine oxidase